MNERIRLLAEQADKLSLQYANKNNINFVDAFNIVFAELIVRECANTASNFVRGPGGDHGVKRVIQQHFGVEE